MNAVFLATIHLVTLTCLFAVGCSIKPADSDSFRFKIQSEAKLTEIKLTRREDGIDLIVDGKTIEHRFTSKPVNFGKESYFKQQLMKLDERYFIFEDENGVKYRIFWMYETIWDDGSRGLNLGIENGTAICDSELFSDNELASLSKEIPVFDFRPRTGQDRRNPFLQSEPKAWNETELARIEKDLKVKLPDDYRRLMVTKSPEMMTCTLPYRGTKELWENPWFYNLDIENLISENKDQRSEEADARNAFPGWWKEYLLIGSNFGGDFYAIKLDGTAGVWYLACSTGEKERYAKTVKELYQKSLNSYNEELKFARTLDTVYKTYKSGKFDKATLEIKSRKLVRDRWGLSSGKF